MNILIFFDQMLEDYADIISVVCIPIVIGIFTFSFPLLFQAASRIDDKYDSTLLIKAFRKDWICRSFIIVLIGALIFCLLWAIPLPRCVDWGVTLNVLIDHSSLILIFISTITLIVFTICVIRLTYIYYLPELLFKRLKCNYKCANNKNKYNTYFIAISRLMQYAIKKSDKKLSYDTLDFFRNEFVKYRKDKSKQKCIYPKEFYSIIEETNKIVYMESQKEISFFNESVMFDLLIDEYQETIMSEQTYNCIWYGIRQALFYNKDEFIYAYWKKAHQYFNYRLDRIIPKYDDYYNVINQEEIKKRNEERERFLEFHYAIGGLLMMKEKYSLLKQIVSWTQQTPPKYVLVPETTSEVIYRFMLVDDMTKYLNPIYYEQRYPFPDISGVNAENIIKMWIKRYISILFLRQYTLQEYLVCSRTLGFPTIPQTLSEKRRWNEELEKLKYYVQEYLSEEQILKCLGLQDLLSNDWYKNNNKTNPIDWIQNLEQTIYDDIKQKKANLNIDINKKKLFIEISKKILDKVFEEMKNLFSQDSYINNLNFISFRGRHEIFDKAAFATDSELSYINANEVLAQCIADELKINSMNIFLKMQNKRFVLKENDIFKAIDSLTLNDKSFVILNPDINLHYYQSLYKNDSLSCKNDKWFFNDIEIINMPYNPYIGQSLIIIKKENLPTIVHNSVDDSIISKYLLKPIDDKLKIYASIIDLNIEKDLKDEIYKETGIHQLEEKVLLCIDMDAVISCNNDAKCIILKVFSQFDDKGTPNTIEQVKELRDFIIN